MEKIGVVIFTDMSRRRADAIHVRNFLEILEKNDVKFDTFFSGIDHRAPKSAFLRLLKQFFGRIPLALRIFRKQSTYSFFYLRDWLFAYFLAIMRIPYVFEVNGLFAYEGLIRGYATRDSFFVRLLRKVERVVSQHALKIVCVSQGIKKYLVDQYGVIPQNCLVARNAANRAVYNELVSAADLPTHKKSFLIGWIGSFDAYHGVDDIVESAEELKRNGCVDVQFLIIGGGEGKDKMQTIVNEHKLEDLFVFLGAQAWDAVPQYLVNVDICLSLDKRTQDNLEYRNIIGVTTIKVFEYLALGKPVLAYELGDAKEFFEGQKIGWVCKPDPKEIAKMILDIKERRAEVKQFGENAARLSRTVYNWGVTVKKIVDFIF